MAEEKTERRSLERLTQDEDGTIKSQDGEPINTYHSWPVGKLITHVVENPCLDVSQVVDEMIERNSPLVPRDANAYVVSDFNPDTQAIRNRRTTSVYAVQFYSIGESFIGKIMRLEKQDLTRR